MIDSTRQLNRSTRMKGLGLVSLRFLKRIFSAGFVLSRP
jgi:hypothetical protein